MELFEVPSAARAEADEEQENINDFVFNALDERSRRHRRRRRRRLLRQNIRCWLAD